MQFSPQIQQLIVQHAKNRAAKEHLKAQKGEDVIVVANIASQLAHLYEKMRYSIDYKEEHLLRRNAIERILKRRLLQDFNKEDIAQSLVTELIRAGYIPNKALPERIIADVDHIIAKAALLIHTLKSLGTAQSGKIDDSFDRVVSIAATELEAFLFPDPSAEATADAFYLTVRDLVDVKDAKKLTDEERNVAIFVACYRSLLEYDEASMYYRLWLLHHPEWREAHNREDIVRFGQVFAKTNGEIAAQLKHPLAWRLLPKLRDYAIYFSLIKESVDKEDGAWVSRTLEPKKIDKGIRSLIELKHQREQSRIMKSVTRVIIYILLTKTILAFIIELPYDIARQGKINYLALGVNVFFHPLLLFVMTRVIRFPGTNNTQRVVEGVTNIAEGTKLLPIHIWMRRKRSVFGAILTILYTVIFVGIFSGIVWILQMLDFNLISGILFILFLTLVSYFGLRIRQRAKKWRVSVTDESATGFFLDVLTLPIIQAGQWITKKFDSINIFVFVLDFIIETPFKIVVEILEAFTNYLREKKEEIR